MHRAAINVVSVRNVFIGLGGNWMAVRLGGGLFVLPPGVSCPDHPLRSDLLCPDSSPRFRECALLFLPLVPARHGGGTFPRCLAIFCARNTHPWRLSFRWVSWWECLVPPL